MAETDGNWITELRVLVPVASTLVTVASNPVQFFRGPFLELAVEYVVIRPLAWGLAILVDAYEQIAAILAGIGPILASPFVLTGDALVSGVRSLYRVLYGLIETAPFAAPIAAVATFVILAAVVLAITYVVVSLVPGSDALKVKRWT